MIKTVKNYDGQWTVFNTENGETATINSIREFGSLASKETRYRIDVRGRTVKSMIDHFATARATAKNLVK